MNSSLFFTCFSFLDLLVELFVLGLLMLVYTRGNFLLVLVGIELMLLALNLSFIFWSYQMDDLLGLVFALVILTLAAAESALGLAIAIFYFRLQGDIFLVNISNLKG